MDDSQVVGRQRCWHPAQKQAMLCKQLSDTTSTPQNWGSERCQCTAPAELGPGPIHLMEWLRSKTAAHMLPLQTGDSGPDNVAPVLTPLRCRSDLGGVHMTDRTGRSHR